MCQRHAEEARVRSAAAYKAAADEHRRLYGMSAHRLRRLEEFSAQARARIIGRLPVDVQARLLVG